MSTGPTCKVDGKENEQKQQDHATFTTQQKATIELISLFLGWLRIRAPSTGSSDELHMPEYCF